MFCSQTCESLETFYSIRVVRTCSELKECINMTEIERRLYFGDLDPQKCSIRRQLSTYEFRISISKVF